MKAILMSIKPEWVAKILNGEKTIEIRKKFPSDFVGWVYIYCTKDRKQCLVRNNINKTYHLDTCYWDDFESNLNGKVVARFWCDKVEYCEDTTILNDDDYDLECSCLTAKEIQNYSKKVYAIHINDLEIFYKPKELNEFKYYKKFSEMDYMLPIPRKETCERLVTLTRAPESFCYIEID